MHCELLGHINFAIARFYCLPTSVGSAHLLRGAMARCCADSPLFHQHDGKRLLYRYPLIQYRWYNGGGIITGINEGSPALLDIELAGRKISLGGQETQIAEVEVKITREPVSVSPVLCRYRFKSPWIPFNQKNYHKYKNMTHQHRTSERDRLLVANLLSSLGALGIHVPCQLYAAFFCKKSVSCVYKSERLVGFFGEFVANLSLPNYLAIGKAVSHGYGWFTQNA